MRLALLAGSHKAASALGANLPPPPASPPPRARGFLIKEGPVHIPRTFFCIWACLVSCAGTVAVATRGGWAGPGETPRQGVCSHRPRSAVELSLQTGSRHPPPSHGLRRSSWPSLTEPTLLLLSLTRGHNPFQLAFAARTLAAYESVHAMTQRRARSPQGGRPLQHSAGQADKVDTVS